MQKRKSGSVCPTSRVMHQSSLCSSVFHKHTCLSWPQDRKMFWSGCVASPHISSTWPWDADWKDKHQFPRSQGSKHPQTWYLNEFIPALQQQIHPRWCLWEWHYGLSQLIGPLHQHLQWYELPHTFLESRQSHDIIKAFPFYLHVTSQSSPSVASHTQRAFHLTLSLRCQVSTPSDDFTIFPSSTEQSTTLQGAQGEHAAFMGSGLPHDLKGLW